MLTQEQILNLKPGAPLVVQGEFCQAYDNGNILVRLSVQRWETSINEIHSFHPSCVSLPSEHGTSVPTPKHDPTRLFRKGDKVRTVKRRGRYYSSADEKYADLILTVHSDEVTDSRQSEIWVEVETEDDETCWNTDPVYLELVTPVEEIEPYKLIDSPNTYNIVRDSAMVMTIHKKSHPNAKAAAEAERDRLNAEYRKEHTND